ELRFTTGLGSSLSKPAKMEKQMSGMNRLLPRFPLGRIVATPGALRALEQANQNPFEFLQRHQAGDWGELCEEDKRENEFSVHNGFRILSAYRTRNDVKIWVITEADRSVTLSFFPTNTSAAAPSKIKETNGSTKQRNVGASAIER